MSDYQLYLMEVRALTPSSKAIGNDLKGNVSVGLYLIAIPLTFFIEWIAEAIYFGVALMWLVPDRRIEKALQES